MTAPLGRTAAALLAWLAERGPATLAEAATAFGMEEASMRGRLVALVRVGLVEAKPSAGRWSRRVYSATAEGRDRVGLGVMEGAPAGDAE